MALALDSGGVPHIVFNDRDAGTLLYVARVGNVSHVSIVDRGTDAIIDGSVATGPGGRIAIAFSHDDFGDSRYSISVRVATYGVDGQNFLDFLWGILPLLLVEGGLFLIAGYLVWRRWRLTARRAPTARSCRVLSRRKRRARFLFTRTPLLRERLRRPELSLKSQGLLPARKSNPCFDYFAILLE